MRIKRHNIWTEIAAKMNERKNYAFTGQQCSAKMAELERIFKNISDQNKKEWKLQKYVDILFGNYIIYKYLDEKYVLYIISVSFF